MRTKPFDKNELEQIDSVLADGLDPSILFKYTFSWWQTREIVSGLKQGVDVSGFAKPEINWLGMANMGEILARKRYEN